MADQTIDSLVVSLGMDTASFKAGVLSAAKGMEDVRRSVKDADTGIAASAKSMGSSIGSLALKFTGLFFAVKGIGDVIHGFKQLSDTLWHLGIDSKNVGLSANELRRWQEVAQLAGGSAEDAAASVGGLQASIFNLRFRGQVSDQLIMLQRLGVAYMTAGGQMRNFKDIALEASQHMDKMGFDKATRYQYALSIGLQGGLATAVAKGTGPLQEYLKTAADDNKDIGEDTVDSQAKLNESVISLQYRTADASSAILTALTPALVTSTDAIHDLTDATTVLAGIMLMSGGAGLLAKSLGAGGGLLGFLGKAGGVLGAGAAGFAVGDLINKLGPKGDLGGFIGGKVYEATHGQPPAIGTPTGGAAQTGGAARPTISERNNNPINLKTAGPNGVLRSFATEAEGEQAALHQIMLDARRGTNTIRALITKYAPASDRNPTAAYIDFVAKRLGKGPDMPLVPAEYPAFIAAMNAFETGKNRLTPASVSANVGIPAAPAALEAARQAVPTPGASLPGGSGAAGAAPTKGPSTAATNVQIDSITVNTQATNASRMAAETDAALRRKLLASNVETGLV